MSTTHVVSDRSMTRRWQQPVVDRINVGIKTTGKTEHQNPKGKGMHFLSRWERFLSAINCTHNWGFPVTLKGDHTYEVKVGDVHFDSHQSCNKCGTHRLFSTIFWAPGALFRRTCERPAKRRIAA